MDEWGLITQAHHLAIKNQIQKESQVISEVKRLYRNDLDEQINQ